MYQNIQIQPLSSIQIKKLLKGDCIRVKFRKDGTDGHVIDVTREQHKKIIRSFKNNGGGVTIQFDPFQQKNHQYVRGVLKAIESNVVKTQVVPFKFVEPQDSLIKKFLGFIMNWYLPDFLKH
jgi:hypothetical protein